MNQLKGKVVFITGGASGIGGTVTEALLDRGVKVFDMSRKSELNTTSDLYYSFKGDVGNESDVKSAFEACDQQFGPPDILINNAGIGIPTPDISETDLETYEKMMNTNMRGVFLCSRESVKRMKSVGKGHILTVVSMAGHRTNPGAPLYCASKFGARGISSGLADQVIKQGIKVTEVNPGPVDTGYWGDRKVPRDKFLKPEDVAKVVLFVLEMPEDVVIREVNFDNMKFLMK